MEPSLQDRVNNALNTLAQGPYAHMLQWSDHDLAADLELFDADIEDTPYVAIEACIKVWRSEQL